jgi:hypothetical protein
MLALIATPAYTDDPMLAPYWERVLRDPGCDHEVDCGFPGITADQCHERKCCFDPTGPKNWCSGTAAACSSRADCSGHGDCVKGACVCDAGFTGFLCAQTAITKVHVIQSCHLDVGFTDLSAGVINRYLSHHIPQAITTAAALRNDSSLPAGWRLKFLAQSYYLSFYLDCPPGMGFACPTAAQQQALRDALRRGDITYHAYPHNAELENTSPVMLSEGLQATKALDAAFGLPPKRCASPAATTLPTRPSSLPTPPALPTPPCRYLSQRDVPGVPRAAVPLMRRAGVELVTVGVNGASMYPRVPKLFRWADGPSGEEMLAMWHPRGRGARSNLCSGAVPRPRITAGLSLQVRRLLGGRGGDGGRLGRDAGHRLGGRQPGARRRPPKTASRLPSTAWRPPERR